MKNTDNAIGLKDYQHHFDCAEELATFTVQLDFFKQAAIAHYSNKQQHKTMNTDDMLIFKAKAEELKKNINKMLESN